MHTFTIKELQIAIDIVNKCLDNDEKSPKLKYEEQEPKNIPEHFCQPQQSIEFYKIKLQIAKNQGDREETARTNAILGNAYNSVGQYKCAIDCYRKYLKFAEEVGDKIELGRANEYLGNVYQSNGQYHEAIECYSKQLDISEKLGNNATLGRACANLGNTYDSIGQYQKAITFINKQLEIAEILGDKADVGRSNANLGNAYHSIGQYEKAIKCHLEDFQISEELGSKEGVGRAQGNLGIVYQSIGDYQKAIDYHYKAFKVSEELGDKMGMGSTNGHLGLAYHSIGQYQKAIDCHCRDLEIAEELKDKVGLGRANANLGNAYQNIGQYYKSIDCYKKYMETAEALRDTSGIGHAQESLGNAYECLSQYEYAIECRRRHLAIAEELGDKAEIGRALANLGNLFKNVGEFNEALECHRKDLEIAEELEDRHRVGRALGNLGNAYDSIGEYQNAINCHNKHLKIAEELDDKEGLAMANGNLGNAYQSTEQYQQAIDCYERHLEIAEERGDSSGVAHAQEGLGNAYQSIYQYKRAIECYGKQLEVAEEMEDTALLRRAHSSLGYAYDRNGEYQKAISCYRKSLDIAEKLGDSEEVGKSHEGLGNAYDNIGQFEKAIECHQKHLEIAQELGDFEGEGTALGNLGNAYRSHGRYQEAIDCHLNNLKIAETLEDKAEVGKVYANLGNAYQSISQYLKAIECHYKALGIAEELEDKAGLGTANSNLGNAYQSIGQYEKALECQLKDLEIADELGDRQALGMAQGNLGNTYDIIGEHQKAIEYHLKHLAIAEELGDEAGAGSGYGNLGNAYQRLGRYQKAIECYSKHLDIAKRIGDIRGMASAQSNLGECHQNDDNRLACSFFAKSILSYHNIRRSTIYQDDFNTSMSNQYAFVHKRLFESLLNLKQVKGALLVSDSGKAKALYDLSRRTVDAVLDITLEDNYTIPIKEISVDPCSKSIEDMLEVALSKVIDLMENGSIISYAFDDQHILHAWVISSKGAFHKQWQTTNGISAKNYLNTVNKEVRESFIASNQGNVGFCPQMHNFHGKPKETFTRSKEYENGNFLRELEDGIQNPKLVSRSLETGKNDRDMSAFKRLQQIYNLDVSSMIRCGHHRASGKNEQTNETNFKMLSGRYSLELPSVTCIPMKMRSKHIKSRGEYTHSNILLRKLYSVYISPIEEYLVGSKILIVPEGSIFHVPFCAIVDSNNENLVNTYRLQFTPSLHVLNSSLFKPEGTLGHALFVGNPTVGEITFRQQLHSKPSLPDSAIEAKECGGYFNSKPLLAENATKENVLKNMKDSSIIHIAAHGDRDHADIFLAPNEGAPKAPNEEYYLLTANDVVNCTLKARLVILSCCYSGRGQISPEGVVGIARSFLGAGARSVLVTLWGIPDASTMEFMKQFYHKVCQGLSACAALQEVMIEQKKKYSLRAWAPFQIVGEDIAFTQEEIKEICRQSSQRFRLASLRPRQPRCYHHYLKACKQIVPKYIKIKSLIKSHPNGNGNKLRQTSTSPSVGHNNKTERFHTTECPPKKTTQISSANAKPKRLSLRHEELKKISPPMLKEKQQKKQILSSSKSKEHRQGQWKNQSASDKEPGAKRRYESESSSDHSRRKKQKQNAVVSSSSKANSSSFPPRDTDCGFTKKTVGRAEMKTSVSKEGCGEIGQSNQGQIAFSTRITREEKATSMKYNLRKRKVTM